MDKCKDGGNRQRGYPLMQDMTERDKLLRDYVNTEESREC